MVTTFNWLVIINSYDNAPINENPNPPPPPSWAMVGHSLGFVKKICPTDGAFAFLFTNRILLVAEVAHKDIDMATK